MSSEGNKIELRYVGGECFLGPLCRSGTRTYIRASAVIAVASMPGYEGFTEIDIGLPGEDSRWVASHSCDAVLDALAEALGGEL